MRHVPQVLSNVIPVPPSSDAVIATAGLLLLVASSCIEGVAAELGPISIRPVHLVAGVFGLWLWVGSRVSEPSLTRATLIACAGIGLAGLIPFVGHRDALRVALPGLLAVNVLLAYVAVLLYGVAGRRSGRRAVDIALALVVALPLIQSALGAVGVQPGSRDTRLFGFGRTGGSFEEATWAGAASAFSASWYLGARTWSRRILAAAAIAGTVLATSRSAILSLCAVLLITVLSTGWVPLIGIRIEMIRRRRGVADALAATTLAVLALAAILFTPWSLLVPTPSRDFTSLDSRILDQRAITAELTGLEILIGSGDTRIFDAHRARTIPSSSNNVVIDAYWKLGLFGLLMLAWLAALVVWILPRSAGIRLPIWRYPPPLLLIVMTLLMSVWNNAILRPWFWVFLGVAIAAAARRGASRESVA